MALVPALAWAIDPTRRWIHRVRCGVVLIGLILIVVNLAIEKRVFEARVAANKIVDKYLKDLKEKDPLPAQATAVRLARGKFEAWHGASLGINMVALLMATAGDGTGGRAAEEEETCWGARFFHRYNLLGISR